MTARSEYEKIASIITGAHPDYSVQGPIEERGGITVYPPENFFSDHGVDVLIEDGIVTLRYDGSWVRTINFDPTSEEVSSAAIETLILINENYEI